MIITSNEELLQFLPQTVSAVEGEPTLFEKLSTSLKNAETWWRMIIAGEADSQCEGNYMLARSRSQAVACYALVSALPKLDLVFTPNGFGVVSNQTVAPASKERVQALSDALRRETDDAVLYFTSNVTGTLGVAFNDRLHKGLMLAFMACNEDGKRLEWQQHNVPYLRIIESELETNILGAPLTEYLVSLVRENKERDLEAVLSKSDHDVLTAVRTAIYYEAVNRRERKKLTLAIQSRREHIVNMIHRSEICLTLWKDSTCPLLWNGEYYSNDKASGAYWL